MRARESLMSSPVVTRPVLTTLIVISATSLGSPPAQRMPLTPEDIVVIRDVAEPRLSPDGAWVAFSVTHDDLMDDKRKTELWIASLDGKESHRVVDNHDDLASLHWAPDGRRITFISARGTPQDRAQLWEVDPKSGASQVLAAVSGDVADYAWAPDGRRLILVVRNPALSTAIAPPDGTPSPAPIVIDRYYFKEDVTGYLGRERHHLELADLGTGTVSTLTDGDYDELKPSWSPDGASIAFVSKRGADPDRHATFGIYTMHPTPHSEQRLLATYQGTTYQGDAASDWAGPPAWSPDGQSLAYVTAGDPRLIFYSVHQLAIVSRDGGTPRFVLPALDRNVSGLHWATDGQGLFALVEDDRNSHLVRVDVRTGRLTRLLPGRRNTTDFDVGRHGAVVVLDSTPDAPDEVYALAGGKLHDLSKQNNAFLARRTLADVEELEWPSSDGKPIHGLMTLPIGHPAGLRYPLIVRLHGGPTSQFANEWDFDSQLLAANGYAVLLPNPRGSGGRGEAFAAAIYADWGNKDVTDVLGGVDHLITAGVADPQHLGIGGWSYGGMLTNYTITRDHRFKAAVSGASLSNQLAAYGTDMYVREYEAELGPPWKNPQTWIKVSYPFFEAERVTTPTLFLCGTLDFSVPLLHSEQMYEALRSLGVDTRLIIYPGQSHSFVRPSFRVDRARRTLEWYARHLRP